MATLGEMAGGIAHEINNPLTILSGSMFIIKRNFAKGTLNEEKLSEISSSFDSTVKRIVNIVNGLRNFSRSGENDLMKEECPESIILETLAFIEHKIKMYEIDLRIDLSQTKNMKMQCQRTQMSQVILNLISNSAEEIQQSNIAPKWIKIDSRITKNSIQIRVTDSGKGISQDIEEKIFQPFFTTKEVGIGTGLGLSISRTILEKHNGKLYLDKEEEHTCFCIEIPL